MSAPRFLVDELPSGETSRLAGPEGRHAADVQRLRPGEQLSLADGRGGVATATVITAERGALELRVDGRWQEPPADPRLVVVQGIGKGDRSELAVQAMTEVGVDEIVPWAAARSVTRWQGDRGEKAWRRWGSTAREAAKQSRRAWLPVLSDPANTAAVAARLATAAVALVLHEEATDRLSGVPLPATGEVVVVVGPEGGVAPAELSVFAEAGAHQVRLGGSVLRTSTAGVAALSVLQARLHRW
ncbi:16S rRNA (uracil(1498)-N(3))-methyltransferase [Natronosporangium hydrolyticum]|uniref:Ribosomal RNA small subunit methyltransferase E n=1 Tax=Natronosporangium hydrolyticum TaxID=2811111 RepID=A0A895YQ37_9ACTN|nr:16S rRNA (uracil(1498)-N(3))-methyltransferase [Natronosporangium hydrolyticum]QSB16098.1 16S rRNA (uracil(1498)-N(3))-methyltransferase [Natronosporangium hydrolyticum]